MDKKIDDGGPSFPLGSGDMRDPTGMTLRDYFAAKAMQGLLASSLETTLNEFVCRAYRLADAMIAARKGGAA